LQISLYGSLETKERLPAVWKILNAPPFSLALDGFEVNHAKATKFRGDPLAEIAAALKKPRISAIRAYRSAASDHAAFMFYPEGTWATITVPLRVADAIPEALIAILDELAVDHGHAGFLKIGPNDHYSYAVHELDPPLPDGDLGWLSIFSETPYFSLDSLESVLRAHGLRTLRSKRNLVAVAPDPHTPMSEETVHAIRLALCPILWRSHAKLRGFVLPDLTDELVKPALEKHGFREVELPPLKRALGERFFVSAHETGARGIYIEPRFPARDGKLDIELRHTRNAPDADLLAGHERSTSVGDKTLHYSEHMPADSEKAARASLTSFLSRLDGDIRRWFEEPPKTKKRR
jgi:hypothetical protein